MAPKNFKSTFFHIKENLKSKILNLSKNGGMNKQIENQTKINWHQDLNASLNELIRNFNNKKDYSEELKDFANGIRKPDPFIESNLKQLIYSCNEAILKLVEENSLSDYLKNPTKNVKIESTKNVDAGLIKEIEEKLERIHTDFRSLYNDIGRFASAPKEEETEKIEPTTPRRRP